MSALQIKVLGELEARPTTGAALKLLSRMAEGAMAYLALSPGVPHFHGKITTLFWAWLAAAYAHVGDLAQARVQLHAVYQKGGVYWMPGLGLNFNR